MTQVQREVAAQDLADAINTFTNLGHSLPLLQIASDFPGIIRCLDGVMVVDQSWVQNG